MNGNKKLWTGKTVKAELRDKLVNVASVKGLSVSYALEVALDGAERAPESSILRETLNYWDSMTGDAQARFLAGCKSELKSLDRIYGRNVTR